MSGLLGFNCKVNESEQVDKRLMCPICNELMNKPVTLSCGHSACRSCLEKMIRRQDQSTKETCHVCQTSFAGQRLGTNIIVDGLIGQIRISCTNDGCTWAGQHEQKEKHFSECPFLVLACPNGCFSTHLRGQLSKHLTTCPNRKVDCQYCKKGIRRFSLAEHEKYCNETPQACPLGCSDKFPRSHVHMHLFKCPNKAVKCTVRGCNNFFKRGKQFLHDMDHADSHQVLLKSEVEELRCALFNKTNTVTTRRVVSTVRCFRWRLKGADVQKKRKVSSPLFGFDQKQFRCLWSKDEHYLYLAMLTGTSAITIKARFVVIKEGNTANDFPCDIVTIKEGEQAGRKVELEIKSDVEEVIIKIILYVYRHM